MNVGSRGILSSQTPRKKQKKDRRRRRRRRKRRKRRKRMSVSIRQLNPTQEPEYVMDRGASLRVT